MPIGDSKGAFFEDDFRAAAHPWWIDPKMEGIDKNVIHPNKPQMDKQLDDAELNPSSGMGIEIRADVEDRRSETPEWSMDRLMDPAPLDKSIGGENRKYGHGFLSDIKDPYFPTQLAKDLGITDIDALKVTDYFKKLGIEQPKEDKPLAPIPADKDPILMTKPGLNVEIKELVEEIKPKKRR